MQKLFITIVLFLSFSNLSYSQTSQGNFVASGATNISLLFSNLDPRIQGTGGNKVKSQNYSFSTVFGYFIIDHLAASINASYQYSYYRKQIYQGPSHEEDIQTTIGLIPSLTYFFPVEGNLKPNVSLGAGYIAMKERNNQYPTPDNVIFHYGGLSLNAGAGVSLFLNKSVSLDLGLQYSRNKLNDKFSKGKSQLQNIFGVAAGVSVYF